MELVEVNVHDEAFSDGDFALQKFVDDLVDAVLDGEEDEVGSLVEDVVESEGRFFCCFRWIRCELVERRLEDEQHQVIAISEQSVPDVFDELSVLFFLQIFRFFLLLQRSLREFRNFPLNPPYKLVVKRL
jgi:hypothetical protein